MCKKNQSNPALGSKAMEMVMRDVLDGMQDLAIMKSYESTQNVFEIIAINPTQEPDVTRMVTEEQNTVPVADIIPFKKQSRA